MQVVALTPDRLPDILALLRGMGYKPGLDLNWLAYRTFGDPTCLPELMVMAEEDGHVRGVCLGCLRGERGLVKLIAVDPAQRGQGIASAMLDAIESRLRDQGATSVAVAGASPRFFEPGVPLANTDLISFLYKRDYTCDRVTRVNMDVDLPRANLDTQHDEERLSHEGIRIGRGTQERIEAVGAFALAHFSPEWQGEVLESARFEPLPLFVAEHEGQVVSFAGYDIGGPGLFGPTGTAPAFRQRGIGGVLLKLCLRDLRDRGDRIAKILWAGPIGYYARAVDARISDGYWTFGKTLVPDPIEG